MMVVHWPNILLITTFKLVSFLLLVWLDSQLRSHHDEKKMLDTSGGVQWFICCVAYLYQANVFLHSIGMFFLKNNAKNIIMPNQINFFGQPITVGIFLCLRSYFELPMSVPNVHYFIANVHVFICIAIKRPQTLSKQLLLHQPIEAGVTAFCESGK